MNYLLCSLTCVFISLLTIAFVVYIFYKNRYEYWKRQNVKFIKPEFVFGNIKRIIKGDICYGEQLKSWYLQNKNEKVFGFYNLFEKSCIPIDLDLIKNILVKDFEYFNSHLPFVNEEVDPLSGNLFFLSGERWRYLRNKISQIFTGKKFKEMFPLLLDCSENMIEFLKDQREIDAKKISGLFTSQFVCSCFFGIDCKSFTNPDDNITKFITKHVHPTKYERIRLFLAHFFPDLFRFFKISQINSDTNIFMQNLIRNAIDYRKSNDTKRCDFLQLLIDLKEPNNKTGLTPGEITAQTFIFFVGGFDTTSTAMSFCLYELAHNREIQEKTREEISNILKKYNNQITYDAVMEMQYLERVIKEVLRKYPPIPFLGRRVIKDYPIKDTNIILEKGVAVFVPLLGLHYDPELFPDPEVFNPDRFLDKNIKNFSWLPFGEGPRICIGLRLGILKLKVGLARILSCYKLAPNENTSYPIVYDNYSFLTTALGGVWLNIQKL